MSVITTYYAVIERKTGLWLNKRKLRKRIQTFVRKGDAIRAKREAMPDPDEANDDELEFALADPGAPWVEGELWEAQLRRTMVKDPRLEVVEVVLQEGMVVG
jgi:hypothetical protein